MRKYYIGGYFDDIIRLIRFSEEVEVLEIYVCVRAKEIKFMES